MRASNPPARPQTGRVGFWDLLIFDRLVTRPVIHLIYWCGLGFIALIGFGVIGAAVGVAIRGGAWEGLLLAVPVLIAGLLMIGVLALLWRGACEFFVAIFSIADNLQALRQTLERDGAITPPPQP